MKKSARLWLCALISICTFLGGWYARQPPPPGSAASLRPVLKYICPMHPSYTSDKPGTAPCCGMQLVPVYADEPGAQDGPGGSAPALGTLNISSQQQQMAGIRIGVAQKQTTEHVLRLPGRVAPDENVTYVINAATAGWIREVYRVTTGSQVQKGQPLATFYSKEFLPAQQNYFYGINNLDRLVKSGSQSPEQLSLTQVQVWAYEDVPRRARHGRDSAEGDC